MKGESVEAPSSSLRSHWCSWKDADTNKLSVAMSTNGDMHELRFTATSSTSRRETALRRYTVTVVGSPSLVAGAAAGASSAVKIPAAASIFMRRERWGRLLGWTGT